MNYYPYGSYLQYLQASSSFLPSNISGLVLWYGSNIDGTITRDGSNNISQWDDQALPAANATATTTQRPTYVANQANGKAIARFNGTANQMLISQSSSSSFTYCAVIKPTSAGERTIVGGNNNGIPALVVNNTQRLHLVRAFQAYLPVNSTTALSTSAFNLAYATYDNATGNYGYYKNGSLDGSGTSAQAWTNGNFRIGAMTSSSFLNADLAELLVFNRALNSTELNQIRDYQIIQYIGSITRDGAGNPVLDGSKNFT